MSEPRWEVKIGSTVKATDGEFGRVQQLLLDPCQERLLALVVRQHGITPFNDLLVSKETVAEATDSEVRLNLDLEQLEALPNYWADTGLLVEGKNYEVDDDVFAVRGMEGFEIVHAPNSRGPAWIARKWQDTERKHLAFRAAADKRVLCNGEYVGQTSQVLLDPGGKIKSFVLDNGYFFGRELIVPSIWIREIDKKNIHLLVDKDDLEMLQEYIPDDRLVDDVLCAIWIDEILRRTDYKEISVFVRDGIVRLEGHVVTPMNKSRAGRAARIIPGVLGLENNLVVDPDLVITVTQALGNDELTRPERISVGAQNGAITLNGRVRSTAVREAAEAAAASVPQVRGVANLLEAPGAFVDPQEEQVQQPPIGRQIIASDGFLGQLEQVVINPRNRRVTAIVASGSFQAPGAVGDDTSLILPTYVERRFLVSIDQIRFEIDSSVMLNISSDQAARNRWYQPADFVRPPEGWRPPYPYQRDEVLFIRE